MSLQIPMGGGGGGVGYPIEEDNTLHFCYCILHFLNQIVSHMLSGAHIETDDIFKIITFIGPRSAAV